MSATAHGQFTLDLALSAPPEAPRNETCPRAEPLTIDPTTHKVSVTGTTVGATDTFAGTCSGGAFVHNGPDVVYAFTLTEPRRVIATVTGSAGTGLRPAVYLRTDCESSHWLDEVVCARAAQGTVTADVPRLPAGTYYVIVDGYYGTSGGFTLELATQAPLDIPDHCSMAQEIILDPSGAGSVQGTLVGANNNAIPHGVSPDAGASLGAGGDLVYFIQLSETRDVSVTVTTEPRSVGIFTAYVRSECGNSLPQHELMCSDFWEKTTLWLPALLRGTYYIWVDNDGLEPMPFIVTVKSSLPIQGGDHCDEATLLTFDSDGIATTQGQTAFALADAEGSCYPLQSGLDLVYRFSLPGEKILEIETNVLTPFRQMVHLRTDCTQPRSEVACGVQTTSDPIHKLVTTRLPEGTYYLWVDGAGARERGEYALKLTATDPPGPPPANDVCANRQTLTFSDTKAVATGQTTQLARNTTQGTCERTAGGDLVYEFTLRETAKVTAKVTRAAGSTAFQPVVYIRTECESDEPRHELSCGRPVNGVATATVNSLVAGTYYVWVDGAGGTTGGFDLEVATAAPVDGPRNDSCASPEVLPTAASISVTGTTINANDVARGSCAPSSAAGDVVYSLTLTEPRSVSAKLVPQSGSYRPSLYLRDHCGSVLPEHELACSAVSSSGGTAQLAVSRLEAGTYFFWVDGAGTAATHGAFTLEVELGAPPPKPANDTCAGAIPLALNATFEGDTTGAADDYGAPPFSRTCDPRPHAPLGSQPDFMSRRGPDVVYSFTPAVSGRFTVVATPATHDLALWVTEGTCGQARHCLVVGEGPAAGLPRVATVEGKAGQTYYIHVDAAGARAGPFSIFVR